MSYVLGLRCRECGREYPVEPVHVCEFCLGPLAPVYDRERQRRDVTRASIEAGPPTLWRYAGLLPLAGPPRVGRSNGLTPLVPAPRLGAAIGHRDLWVKNDAVNPPTLSFKDRVVPVALSKAIEFGFRTVSCASTGNLANSVAAHAAEAGLECVIFIPADLEAPKVLGTAVFGATVVGVEGTYDDVNRLCAEIAGRRRWAFVNVNLRPYYAEGSKTMGYEICEQLSWRAPRHIVVPVASGSLITKTALGVREFMDLGLVPEAPVSYHVAQADGCSPVAAAVAAGRPDCRPVRPRTIAKSIAIGNPADGYYAAKVCLESGGAAAAVTDDEVVEGIRLLAETEGILTETAGGVTIAAARRLIRDGRIPPDERCVLLVTGNGLKTIEVLEDRLAPALRIRPTVAAFEEAMAKGKAA